MVQHLRDLVDGALVRLDAHELRIVHVLVGELGDAVRQRRREQHVQALIRRRHAPQQETDVLDETEVEHAVGLVEHHHLDRVQAEDMLLVVVDDAPGRADEHIDASLEHLALFVVAGAAVDQPELETGVPTEHLGVLVDLHRELARRRQHQHARTGRLALGRRRVFQQMVERREQERRGLAGAGLRLAGHVAARKGNRQRLGLDRGAEIETRFAHALKQRFRQDQAGERFVGKMVITHTNSRQG